MHLKKIIPYSLTILFFLTACTSGSLDFNLQYNTINALKKGDYLVCNDAPIGQVNEIVYTDDGKFLVTVTVDNAHAHLPTATSLFFITTDPTDDQKRVIEMLHDTDGPPVKAGQTITGTTTLEGSLKKLQGRFEKEMSKFNDQLSQLWEEVLKVPDSQQLKKFEAEIDRILKELGTLSEKARKKLETEIIPNLLKQFEELRKKFEGKGHDEELDAIENKLKKISTLQQVKTNSSSRSCPA